MAESQSNCSPDEQESLAEIHERSRRQQAIAAAGRPKPVSRVMSELMAHRGYARIQEVDVIAQAWLAVAGEEIALKTRLGNLRRGTLEIVVAHSTLVQELAFQKAQLLEKLAQRLPDHKVCSLRFRVGPIH